MYRLHHFLVWQILTLCPDTEFVDRFACRSHSAPIFPLHTVDGDCPFSHEWGSQWSWIDGAFSDYHLAIGKLITDRGRAVVVAPNCPNAHWFKLLQSHAFRCVAIEPQAHTLSSSSRDTRRGSGAGTPPWGTTFAFFADFRDPAGHAPIPVSRHIRLPSPLSNLRFPSCRFHLPQWKSWLAKHPDSSWVARLLHCIQWGAPLGYTGDRSHLRKCCNLPSSRGKAAAAAVDRSHNIDMQFGRLSGPFDEPPFANLRCSPIGTVPKKGTSKLRVISHQSWPRGSSNNDSIETSHMSFASFDTAVSMMRRLGRNTLFFVFDIESAYKQVMVRPQDRHLLGEVWRGKYYFYGCLLFGGKSSGFIWEDFAVAIEWILRHEGKFEDIMHYVDDFLQATAPTHLGDPDHARAAISKSLILAMLAALKVPVADDKLKGPFCRIKFLGLLLDSSTMTLEIPEDRISDTLGELARWRGRTRAFLKDIQSLAGKLFFLTRIFRMGRAFLSRIIKLIKIGHGRDCVSLDDHFAADIQFWLDYLPRAPRIAACFEDEWSSGESINLATDASLTYGMGGFFQGEWFSEKWTEQQLATARRTTAYSLPYLELHAIVTAAATWAHRWHGKRILFHTDSETACKAINKLFSSDHGMQRLLRSLVSIGLTHSCEFRTLHIPGLTNTLADPLSRGLLQVFRARCPTASPGPTPTSELPLHSYEP